MELLERDDFGLIVQRDVEQHRPSADQNDEGEDDPQPWAAGEKAW
jgi:hypothetical protein